MADRRFKPGNRTGSPQLRGTGKMSEERYAWLRTAIGQFVLMRYPEGEEEKEIGPTIRLYLPRPGARPVSYNLTALTAEELKLTREFFNLLFDLAEPVVEQRDKVAQDAYDAGDDSFVRIYRAVPQFVIRQGSQRGHNQGVHDGPESDAPRTGGNVDSAGRVPGDGGALADSEPEEGSGEDDWSEADQP